MESRYPDEEAQRHDSPSRRSFIEGDNASTQQDAGSNGDKRRTSAMTLDDKEKLTMNERTHFNKVTGLQILGVLIALLLACFIEASSDWVASLNPPSLTIGAIAIDAVGLLLVGLILGIPVTILFWNKVVSPIFEVRKIRYIHGLVIFTVIYWFRGL